jgi:radical SAM superfamily enzyme YgiQ (UPF0313 family)
VKVILINPRSKNPHEYQQKCFAPINLLYLASSLESQGHTVEAIDANALGLEDEAIIGRLQKFQPDIVGITLLSELLLQTHRLTRAIKNRVDGVKIVIGGPHANALPKKVLEEFESVDFVISGEGEESIRDLCRNIEYKDPLNQVKGLHFRNGGSIVSNWPVRSVEDLDGLNKPARHLLKDVYKKKLYHIILLKQRPVDTIITSRGCTFNCRFCCNNSKEYRARSPQNVLAEIVESYSRGISNFDIADADFTFDKARAIQIFEMIRKENLNISFRIKSRTDGVDEELVRKAKEAGAYLISLGMESGSQRILNAMAKGTKIDKNVEACGLVMKAGLKLNTGWIVGFPGETPETVEETVRLVTKIKPTTANINILIPYPGTDVYEEAKNNKTLVGDWSVENKEVPWVRLPWVDSYGDLQRIVQRARNRVYYRPYYVFNFAKEIVGGANLGLARYAFQESIKSFKNT